MTRPGPFDSPKNEAVTSPAPSIYRRGSYDHAVPDRCPEGGSFDNAWPGCRRGFLEVVDQDFFNTSVCFL